MAGPASNYADEIREAILTAMENRYNPSGGVRYEPPVSDYPSDVAFQQAHPDFTVPIDVSKMILGMQDARRK